MNDDLKKQIEESLESMDDTSWLEQRVSFIYGQLCGLVSKETIRKAVIGDKNE